MEFIVMLVFASRIISKGHYPLSYAMTFSFLLYASAAGCVSL